MLDRENTGLIIVDIQGKLARLVNDSEILIANCTKLIQGAKALDLPIVLLEQNPERLGTTVTELTSLLEGVPVVSKFTFNGCDCAELIETIKANNRSHWLVCGIEAHICVYQTARGLAELGYHVELVSDCISSRDKCNVQLGVDRMRAHGIQITSLEMCLYELVRDCRAPEFKSILNLVR